MYKVVVIEGKKIPMKSTGRTARLYSQYFHKDFLTEYSNLSKLGKGEYVDTSIIENIAWIMAKTANDKIPDIDEWLDKFSSPLSIYEKSEDILSVLKSSFNGSVVPKKKEQQKSK